LGTVLLCAMQGASQRHKRHEQAPSASGTLASHAADVAEVIRHIGKPPVLVGHSFGGLIMQRYAIEAASGSSGYPPVRALAFLASSSPTGTDFGRFFKRAPVMSFKVCLLQTQLLHHQNAKVLLGQGS
jgi:pimeloyl-ACP methyl ester carboxylesterase